MLRLNSLTLRGDKVTTALKQISGGLMVYALRYLQHNIFGPEQRRFILFTICMHVKFDFQIIYNLNCGYYLLCEYRILAVLYKILPKMSMCKK